MFDVDHNLFSPFDLEQDQVTQDFQVDPLVTTTPLTEPCSLKLSLD